MCGRMVPHAAITDTFNVTSRMCQRLNDGSKDLVCYHHGIMLSKVQGLQNWIIYTCTHFGCMVKVEIHDKPTQQT